MPKIPQYNQRAGLNISNPTGFQNAGAAGGSEKDLQDFGAQVSKTAVVMNQFFQAKKSSDEEILKKQLKVKSEEAIIGVREELKNVPPEKRLEEFTNRFNKRMEPELKGVSNANALLEVDFARVNALGDFQRDATRDSIEIAKLKTENIHNSMKNLVEANPSVENTLAKIKDNDELLDNTLVFGAVERESLRAKRNGALAISAVESLKRQGKFQLAMTTVDKLSPYLSDQDGLRDSIAQEAQAARRLANEQDAKPLLTPQQRALKQREKSDAFFSKNIAIANKQVDAMFPTKNRSSLSSYYGKKDKSELGNAYLIKEQMLEYLAEDPRMKVQDALIKSIDKIVPKKNMKNMKAQGVSKDLDQSTPEGITQSAQELAKKLRDAKTPKEQEFVRDQIKILKDKKIQLEREALEPEPKKGTK